MSINICVRVMVLTDAVRVGCSGRREGVILERWSHGGVVIRAVRVVVLTSAVLC